MTARTARTRTLPRRLAGRNVAFAALTGVLGAVVWGAGCGSEDGIVGGACAAGYAQCGSQCVTLSSDPNNCGTCGNVCASGTCSAGHCPGGDATTDAPRDALQDASDASDGTMTGDGPGETGVDVLVEGALPEAGDGSDVFTDAPGEGSGGDGGDGTVSDAPGDACGPPFTTIANCGGCGNVCQATEFCSPVGLPVDGGVDAGLDGSADGADVGPNTGVYRCVSMCPSPYVACGGTCIDVTSDPDNCGGCGVVCASGICAKGACTGATPGHTVVIGHDYASAGVTSEASLLANAVFLPRTNPLRVLSFEQYADTTQMVHVKAILKAAAQSSGRTLTLTPETDYTRVPADLVAVPAYDVVLVYDQPNAPTGTLATIGAAWQTSITKFFIGGGDVVVLDGASGAHPEMATLLTSSGLLLTSSEVPIATGTQLLVVASGDAVGNFVVSPYAAQTDTVSFVTSEANGGNVTYVVDELTTGGLVPVVIHKTSP